MDRLLAKEVRNHKVETEDRLASLELAVSNLAIRLSQLEGKPQVVNVVNQVDGALSGKLQEGFPPENFRPVGVGKKAKD